MPLQKALQKAVKRLELHCPRGWRQSHEPAIARIAAAGVKVLGLDRLLGLQDHEALGLETSKKQDNIYIYYIFVQ